MLCGYFDIFCYRIYRFPPLILHAAVRRGVTRGVTRAASPHYVTVSMNRRGRGLYNKEIDFESLAMVDPNQLPLVYIYDSESGIIQNVEYILR